MQSTADSQLVKLLQLCDEHCYKQVQLQSLCQSRQRTPGARVCEFSKKFKGCPLPHWIGSAAVTFARYQPASLSTAMEKSDRRDMPP